MQEAQTMPDLFRGSLTKKTAKRSRVGTSIPDDWAPTNGDREYGRALNLSDAQIDSMAEDLRLWAGANANRAVARKASWSLAFKSWMRREAAKLKGRGGPPRSGGNAFARLAARSAMGEED